MQLMAYELPLFQDERDGGKRSTIEVQLLDGIQIGGFYCRAGTFAKKPPLLPERQ